MAGTKDSFSYGKRRSFLCKAFSLFLPCNMAAVQNLSSMRFSLNRLKKSPVTLALVISIVTLYFVLLFFCVRADKRDKKKLEAVYLKENLTSGICQR